MPDLVPPEAYLMAMPKLKQIETPMEMRKRYYGRYAPTCPTTDVGELVGFLGTAMMSMGIDTPLRMAAFMGQVALESGQCRWFYEFTLKDDPNFSRYERGRLGRKLGNVRYRVREEGMWLDELFTKEEVDGNWPEGIEHELVKGLGKKYSGHGLIQTTGYDNHRDFDEWLHEEYDMDSEWEDVDLVETPELIAKDMRLGVLAAVFYWDRHDLNLLADDLLFPDDEYVSQNFKAITKAINGGYNHLEHRVKFYLRFLQVFGKWFAHA